MVHLYRLGGYNIAIDQNSGAIHVLDEETYDVLACFVAMAKRTEDPDACSVEEIKRELGMPPETINEIMVELSELRRAGKLMSEDPFVEQAGELKKLQSVLKAMCLHVAHSCNMDCEYCFAGKGEYHDGAGLMDLETGKKAIDFLVANSPGRKNLEVDFFGGEPLLDWDVIKELVAYGRSIEEDADKKFRFTLTTNGLLVDDEVIDFCNREMSNVVMSLDGRPDVNDRVRRTKEGKGTYELIINKFKRFADKRSQGEANTEYYIRGTFTKHNLDFAEDILYMADLGFAELSMEPVVASPDAEYALDDEDLPEIFEQYEKLAFEMNRRRRENRPFTFYHYMIDLEGGPCIAKRIAGCGVGTEYIAVTPEGEIYPCHQFVGEEGFLMGDLEDGITNPNVRELFAECNVYSRAECRECFARLYCAGGCAANAYHSTGSIKGTYEFGCKLHKKRIECAIMMKADELEASDKC